MPDSTENEQQQTDQDQQAREAVAAAESTESSETRDTGDEQSRGSEQQKGESKDKSHNRDKAIQKLQQRISSQAKHLKKVDQLDQKIDKLAEAIAKRGSDGPTQSQQQQTEQAADDLQSRIDSLKDADIVENPDAFKKVLGDVGKEVSRVKQAAQQGSSGLAEKLDQLNESVNALQAQQERSRQQQQIDRWWQKFHKRHPDVGEKRADALLDEAREYVEDELGLDSDDDDYNAELQEEFLSRAGREQAKAELKSEGDDKDQSGKKKEADVSSEQADTKQGSSQKSAEGTDTVPTGASAKRPAKGQKKGEKPPMFVPNEKVADYVAAGYDVRG